MLNVECFNGEIYPDGTELVPQAQITGLELPILVSIVVYYHIWTGAYTQIYKQG